jgi:hypothetical protein
MIEAIDTFEEALTLDLTDREAGFVVAELAKAYRAVGALAHGTRLVEHFLGAEFDVPLDAAVNSPQPSAGPSEDDSRSQT